MRLAKPWLLALSIPLAGCKPTPAVAPPEAMPAEPEPEPTPEVAPEIEPEPTPDPEPEPEVAGPYELVWAQRMEGWNAAAVMTPQGDPLFAASGQLFLLARDDGRELARAGLRCTMPNNGLVVIDETTAGMGCNSGLYEVDLPGLAIRRVFSIPRGGFDAHLEAFHATANFAVYASRDGHVRVLRRATPEYEVAFEIKTGARIESLVITPNERWLVVGEGGKDIKDDGTIAVYDMKDGKELRRSTALGRSRVTALSASPDSTQVFVHMASFEATVWNLDTAAWGASFKIGSWLSSSVWLTPTLVAGAGSDGAALFPIDRSQTVPLSVNEPRSGAMAGAAGSADGALFCSGDREGLVACWSNRPVAPSTYQPPPPLAR